MLTNEQKAFLARQQKYSNLLEWWAAGFKGGGVIWDSESPTSDHGDGTENSVGYASPNGKVIRAAIQGSLASERFVIYNSKKLSIEEFLVQEKVKFITSSVGGPAEDGLTENAKFWINLRSKYNLIINSAAGNIGARGACASLPSAACDYWCASGLNKNNVPTRDGYSSVDPENDFTNFTGIQEGTSFSSPYGTGMEDVILSRYGYDWTYDQMYQFIKMICKDMGISGFDNETGWGIPVLPKLSRKLIQMNVGSNQYTVDSVLKETDSVPNTKTYVDSYGNNILVVFAPVRVISETFGKTVTSAVNKDKSVTAIIMDSNTFVTITTGSSTMQVTSGKASVIVPLQLPAYINAQNRMIVPIRPVLEAFGSKLGWVQSTKEIMILQ